MIYTAKPFIGEEEKRAVLEVLNSGMIASGEKVREFEQKFSEYIGTKFAITTSNGTTALDVMLKASNIKEGDEVIVPSFTFIATANSVLYQKAKPVFADIDETYNLDINSVLENITPKTKAILLVHMFGNPVNLKPFLDLQEDKGIIIFEDSAQAHGALYKGRKVGSFGLASSFSFYATKNMTTGEGGAVLTNNGKIAKRARLIINHGQTKKYEHEVLGYNYRMTNINAAIGLEQLKKLDSFNKKRRENSYFLTSKLKGVNGIIPPKETPNSFSVYHQYVIRVVEEEYGESREKLINRLKENSIVPAIHYPKPIHEQPLYKKLGIKPKKKLENTERFCKEVLSLPIHPLVPKEALEKMVEIIS